MESTGETSHRWDAFRAWLLLLIFHQSSLQSLLCPGDMKLTRFPKVQLASGIWSPSHTESLIAKSVQSSFASGSDTIIPLSEHCVGSRVLGSRQVLQRPNVPHAHQPPQGTRREACNVVTVAVTLWSRLFTPLRREFIWELITLPCLTEAKGIIDRENGRCSGAGGCVVMQGGGSWTPDTAWLNCA
jgi:hypothetical protein